MFPRLEVVARHRPVAVVGVPTRQESYRPGDAHESDSSMTPFLAPYAACEVTLGAGSGTATLSLSGSDGTRLCVDLTGDRVSLQVSAAGSTTAHRSRRHGRVATPPARFALALTGTHLSALSHEAGAWVVRGRVDLAGRVDTRDTAWLATLQSSWKAEPGRVTAWSVGAFGQLGLRDVRLVTHADGSPYREAGAVHFTATSAGPGFFDTAHTSVWRLEGDDPPEHRADLYFQRPDRPGSFGDHATHLVRDADRWLVATSTWADFPSGRSERRDATVAVTLAETTDDVLHGQHLLATRPLPLPTAGASVGVWDPHLVRGDDGTWHVGYVSARKFFDFHPELATGPTLDDLTLRGAAPDRRATEGTTVLRIDDQWRVLASDGRGNARGVRGRFTVFDLALREIGTLTAPYPTNIPWPTLVPPDPDRADDTWSLVTFNGAPAGGGVTGYGTHGDIVVMRPAR